MFPCQETYQQFPVMQYSYNSVSRGCYVKTSGFEYLCKLSIDYYGQSCWAALCDRMPIHNYWLWEKKSCSDWNFRLFNFVLAYNVDPGLKTKTAALIRRRRSRALICSIASTDPHRLNEASWYRHSGNQRYCPGRWRRETWLFRVNWLSAQVYILTAAVGLSTHDFEENHAAWQ